MRPALHRLPLSVQDDYEAAIRAGSRYHVGAPDRRGGGGTCPPSQSRREEAQGRGFKLRNVKRSTCDAVDRHAAAPSSPCEEHVRRPAYGVPLLQIAHKRRGRLGSHSCTGAEHGGNRAIRHRRCCSLGERLGVGWAATIGRFAIGRLLLLRWSRSGRGQPFPLSLSCPSRHGPNHDRHWTVSLNSLQTGAGEYARQRWLHYDGQAHQ